MAVKPDTLRKLAELSQWRLPKRPATYLSPALRGKAQAPAPFKDWADFSQHLSQVIEGGRDGS